MKIFNKNEVKANRKNLRQNMNFVEVKLWMRLKGRQIENCKFRRQYSVDKYILDFYCPELKLAIEVDGITHFLNSANETKDRERQKYIEGYNIMFLRFMNWQVKEEVENVLEVIRNKIIEIRLGHKETTLPFA